MTETHARAVVAARSVGHCEICRQRATDYAHRTPRSQGGPWAPSNACHLCHNCHAWCHANPHAARAGGWIVRSTHNPTVVPVWLDAVNHGRGWYLLGDDGLTHWVAPEDHGLPTTPALPEPEWARLDDRVPAATDTNSRKRGTA